MRACFLPSARSPRMLNQSFVVLFWEAGGTLFALLPFQSTQLLAALGNAAMHIAFGVALRLGTFAPVGVVAALPLLPALVWDELLPAIVLRRTSEPTAPVLVKCNSRNARLCRLVFKLLHVLPWRQQWRIAADQMKDNERADEVQLLIQEGEKQFTNESALSHMIGMPLVGTLLARCAYVRVCRPSSRPARPLAAPANRKDVSRQRSSLFFHVVRFCALLLFRLFLSCMRCRWSKLFFFVAFIWLSLGVLEMSSPAFYRSRRSCTIQHACCAFSSSGICSRHPTKLTGFTLFTAIFTMERVARSCRMGVF